MSPEFSAFLSDNGPVIVVVGGILAAIGLVQWRKVRIAEAEHAHKQALIDRGLSPVEIERTLAATPPARRGLLEQFGELSGGAKAGVIIAVIIVGCVVTGCISSLFHSRAYYSHASGQRPPTELQPPHVGQFDAIPGHTFYLDLQPVSNQKLTDVIGENGHSLATVPRGRRELGGVPFQVGPGYLRLRGRNRPELPEEAADVRVGFAFDRLHILHGTEYGAFGGPAHEFHVPDGTRIGHYRVCFADGEERSIPIEYGRDVRDVWNWEGSRAVTRGKVVWTGRPPAAAQERVTMRLYLTTWTNPRPEVEVTHIDFVSACTTAASPFCVALTADRVSK